MGRKIDLTGQRFGKLVVMGEAEPDIYFIRSENRFTNRSQLRCKCDCGEEKTILRNDIISGNTNSCGCLEKENRRRNNESFIKNKIWQHDNTLRFHEKDTQEKGTKITMLRPDRPQKNNTSGVRGVTWDSSREKWIAHLYFKGKRVLNKRFSKKQDAINARKEAEEKYFKPVLEKYGKEI